MKTILNEKIQMISFYVLEILATKTRIHQNTQNVSCFFGEI